MMPDPATLPDREVFVGWVHDALTHLYDTHFLNKHPLAGLLAGTLPDATQRSQALRRLLVDTIRALRPPPGTPAQSPDWRGHHILEMRYIEGLTPAEAMERLALSKSHYFREQARVVGAVADRLWAQVVARPSPALLNGTADGSRSTLAQAEVERLCAQATWEEVDAAGLIAALRPVIKSLAEANGVTLQMASAAPFPVAQGNRTLLRQSILNVVSYALDMAQGGSIHVEPVSQEGEAGFAIRAERPMSGLAAETQRQGVGLEIARRLVEAMRGRLVWRQGVAGWEARLLWPTAAGQTLLVIDDNRAFIDLIRRYLNDSAWRVLGAGNGAEARRLAAE
ncbi:MAG: hybrid sensor histidine kinase/response regulator [Caldilineaceae bacterium]|nr:hybrid sensor histidine kinase/response regulator [Caldilineaceae bacterium]